MSLGRQGLGEDGQPVADIEGPDQRRMAGSTGVTLGTVWGCNCQNKWFWGQQEAAFWRALHSQEQQGRCGGVGGKRRSTRLHHSARCY